MTPNTPPFSRIKLIPDIEAMSPRVDDTTLFQAIPAVDVTAQAGGESAFSFNFAGNVYEDGRWFGADGYLELLKASQARYVNLTGAAQYEQAVQRALMIQAHIPAMHIVWRHMIHQPPGATDNTDKGMWRLPYREFVDNLVIAHNYHTRRWLVVTDCEGHIGADELVDYARMEAERLDYGVPKGCRFAVLRMSTHHPAPAILNSGVLDPLLEAVKRNMGDYDNPNVIISNNGYFDDNNVDGLRTADLIQRRCEDKFKFTPVIVMGEYNYDRGLTSEHGPNAEGMSAEVLSAKLNARYNEQLRGKRVLVYCIGIGQDKKVKNFHMDNDTAKLVAQNAPRFEKPPMVAQPNPLIQPTQPLGSPKRVRIGGNRNLRYGPDDRVPNSVIRTLQAGTEFDLYPDTKTEGNGYPWYWEGNGWVSDAKGTALFGTGSAFAEVADPAPPVPPLPAVESSAWTARLLTLTRELLDAPFLEAGKHTDLEGNVYDHERGKLLIVVSANTLLAVYLDILYKADDHQFIGVKVDAGGKTHIGWMAVAVDGVGEQFAPPTPPVTDPTPPPIEEEPPIEDDDTQPAPPTDAEKEARKQAWKLLSDGFKALAEANDKIAQGYQALLLLEDLNTEEAA